MRVTCTFFLFISFLYSDVTGIRSYHFSTNGRVLELVLWYPTVNDTKGTKAQGAWRRAKEARNAPIANCNLRYPLILLSHGYAGSPYSVSWIAEILTKHGYIVAAPHHSDPFPNKIEHLNLWRRPLELKQVLDYLLESQFAKHIDFQRIGVIGYSLGGTTALWVSGALATRFNPGTIIPPEDAVTTADRRKFNKKILEKTDFDTGRKSFRDPRVKAAIVFAPTFGWIFDKIGLSSVKIPIAIIVPEYDEIVPITKNGKFFADHIPHSRYIELKGLRGHYLFLNIPSKNAKGKLSPRFHRDFPGISRAEVHKQVGAFVVDFFNKNLQ